MKGVIFNLFEDFVSEGWGDDAYDALLQTCPLHTKGGIFVGPETYPDGDLVALLTKACERFDVPPPDALRAFGTFCFSKFATKYPVFFEGIEGAKAFLLIVHDVIHVEVRKLFKDAVPPSFEYDDSAPDRLVIQYRSDRKLCHLMEGLLDGVAEHFATTIDRTQRQCMFDGASVCEFDLTFAD
jgi:hypothetical protein